MKLVAITRMKLICLSLILFLFTCVPARGQEGRIQISSLDKLEAKAVQTVDVTVDGSMMQLASKFLSSERSPDEAKVKELVAGLKGVYVKRYEFDKEGQYSAADVEAIRAQLNTPAWSRLVGIRSKRDGQNVEVFSMLSGNRINALAILAAEPKALTVVNIVGTIDIDKLSELEGKFGVPQLELERDGKSSESKR